MSLVLYLFQVGNWLFLCFGALLLACGIAVILLCRIQSLAFTRHQRRTGSGRRRTRPCRREPLPVWTVDAIDPSFRPPPTYYEAIHWSVYSIFLFISSIFDRLHLPICWCHPNTYWIFSTTFSISWPLLMLLPSKTVKILAKKKGKIPLVVHNQWQKVMAATYCYLFTIW